MEKNMFMIVDWAGNRIFPDRKFKTFEDGWEAIHEAFPDATDEDLGEYEVIPTDQD